MDQDVNLEREPEATQQPKQAKWLADNRAAIEDYNANVERYGSTLSATSLGTRDDLRSAIGHLLRDRIVTEITAS